MKCIVVVKTTHAFLWNLIAAAQKVKQKGWWPHPDISQDSNRAPGRIPKLLFSVSITKYRGAEQTSQTGEFLCNINQDFYFQTHHFAKQVFLWWFLTISKFEIVATQDNFACCGKLINWTLSFVCLCLHIVTCHGQLRKLRNAHLGIMLVNT